MSLRVNKHRPPPAAYDEARTARGGLRRHYQDVWAVRDTFSKADQARFLVESRKAFGGANALHWVPRVLTKKEYETLRRGVVQRGTALRMFLQDHISGKKTYAKIIAPELVDEIMARYPDAGLASALDVESIAFPYGPDIARTKDGRFVVIEDNLGRVGGPGDLVRARETLFELAPAYKDKLVPLDDPRSYFEAMVARARERAHPKQGRIVFYMVPPYADNEEVELRSIMRKLGVEVVTPNSRSKLEVTDGAVFLRSGGRRERVGFVFLQNEAKDTDLSHPATRAEFMLGWARDFLDFGWLEGEERDAVRAAMKPDAATGALDLAALEKALRRADAIPLADLRKSTAVPGLLDCIVKGKVPSSFTPACDWVGDKQFKGYVDKLVRFYLGERPILRSIPVISFAKRNARGELVADVQRIDRMFKGRRYERFVFKPVNGRAGDGVHIGGNMSAREAKAVEKAIRASVSGLVAEPFVVFSTLDGFPVDIRLLAMVDSQRVTVAPTPFVRGGSKNGNGMLNMAKGGRELAAMVVE